MCARCRMGFRLAPDRAHVACAGRSRLPFEINESAPGARTDIWFLARNLQRKQGGIRAMVESVWELPQRSSDAAVIGGLDEGFDSPQKRRCRSGKEASAPCDIGRGRAGPTIGRVANLGYPRDFAVSERACIGVPFGLHEARRWTGMIPRDIGGARVPSTRCRRRGEGKRS